MSALIEQLVEEFNKVFNEKWLVDKLKIYKWRSIKNKPPDPEDYSEIWIRDVDWNNESISAIYYYEDNKWKYRRIPDEYDFSEYDINYFDIWYPKLNDTQPDLPSVEFIEKYMMKYRTQY